MSVKLDGVDDRPFTDQLHHCQKINKNCDTWQLTQDTWHMTQKDEQLIEWMNEWMKVSVEQLWPNQVC